MRTVHSSRRTLSNLRKIAISGAVAGAVGAGLLGATAAPSSAAGPGPSWITAGGSRTIYRGAATTIYGTAGANYRAAAGMQVALQTSINGRWYAKGVRTTDRLGRVAFTFRPASTAAWRLALIGTARSRQSYSPALTVRINASRGAAVVAAAARQAGKPYRFGAAGPSAFDCSGLTLYVFRQFGFQLPHSATAQSRYGRSVAAASKQPGDLIYFGRPGAYYHVAIYAGGGTIWEAATYGKPVGRHPIWSSTYAVRRLA